MKDLAAVAVEFHFEITVIQPSLFSSVLPPGFKSKFI